MDEDIVLMVLGFLVVAVPVFGFTARFALKPLLELALRLREGGGAPDRADDQLLALVQEMQRLRAAVERLEARDAGALPRLEAPEQLR